MITSPGYKLDKRLRMLGKLLGREPLDTLTRLLIAMQQGQEAEIASHWIWSKKLLL